MPFTVNNVTQQSDGDLVFECTLDGQPHRVQMNPQALYNRMGVYGLPNKNAALVAIMKEHEVRLKKLAPLGQSKQDKMGGNRPDLSVVIPPQAQTVIDNILSRV